MGERPKVFATSLVIRLKTGVVALDEREQVRSVVDDHMEACPRHHHVTRTWDCARAPCIPSHRLNITFTLPRARLGSRDGWAKRRLLCRSRSNPVRSVAPYPPAPCSSAPRTVVRIASAATPTDAHAEVQASSLDNRP